MTTSPSPWAGTRALFPTVPEQSATTVRRAGAFLRTRCGTLEEAFRALDPASTGSLTLESFARGMEKLGYESSLAETTQVFQAMDTGFRGSVGMASFLMAFNDNVDDSRLSLQSARAVASSIVSVADSVTGRSGSSCPSVLDTTDRELDMSSQARRVVEDMLEEKIACSAVRLEVGIQADIAHLRDQIAECERSAKTESARLVERIEAKCMDAWSAAVEELNGKIESLRQKLREAELAAAQQQLDVCAVGTKIDSTTSETRGQLKMLQCEFQEKLELMQSAMDGTLQACRAEMREWLDEERTATNDRTQALGRALTEEFQHSIVAQATASARTEACAVTCQVVSKEFETWQKDGGAVQSDLVQVGERLSKLEQKLMSLDLLEGNGLTARSLAADVHGAVSQRDRGVDKLEEVAEKHEEDAMTPPRLEGMLLSILEKLDNKCLDSFATDMKELSSLLEDSRLKGGNFRDLSQKLHEIDSTAYAASTNSEASVAEVSSASKVQDTIDRPSAETSKGMSIQKLREDIFGYLRSEFQDVVSQTIAGINIKERSLSPSAPINASGSVSLPPAGRENNQENKNRDLSRCKPQDSHRPRLHSGVHSSPNGSPATGYRNLDQRIGFAPDSSKRRDSGSIGPINNNNGSCRSPVRVHCADMRGSRSPPPPKNSNTTSITSRPGVPTEKGPPERGHYMERGTLGAQLSRELPLTPKSAGRLIPAYAGSLSVERSGLSVEAPSAGRNNVESRTEPGAADPGTTKPQLQVSQAQSGAPDPSHKSALISNRSAGPNHYYGRLQSVPPPEEVRSAAVQAMHQRSSLSGHPGRSLSEAGCRSFPPHTMSRNRAAATESAPK